MIVPVNPRTLIPLKVVCISIDLCNELRYTEAETLKPKGASKMKISILLSKPELEMIATSAPKATNNFF